MLVKRTPAQGSLLRRGRDELAFLPLGPRCLGTEGALRLRNTTGKMSSFSSSLSSLNSTRRKKGRRQAPPGLAPAAPAPSAGRDPGPDIDICVCGARQAVPSAPRRRQGEQAERFSFFLPASTSSFFFLLSLRSHGKKRNCACEGSLSPCLRLLHSQLACKSQNNVIMRHAGGKGRAHAAFIARTAAEKGGDFLRLGKGATSKCVPQLLLIRILHTHTHLSTRSTGWPLHLRARGQSHFAL